MSNINDNDFSHNGIVIVIVYIILETKGSTTYDYMQSFTREIKTMTFWHEIEGFNICKIHVPEL